MLEKLFILENIPLVDFLGTENANINEIMSAFPDTKIISRGNEITIQGAAPQLVKINEVLNSLILHYQKYGNLTRDHVISYLADENHLNEGDDLTEILVYGTKGIKISAKTPNQKKLVTAVQKNDLVFALGPAGTGKTYISVALAVKSLKNKDVAKIIITRPAVEAGESLGFLPGDLKDKIDPYLRPIYDALSDMVPLEKLKFYQENNIIEIAPLAYMRGRTLNNAFILLDEAQNATQSQIKMFLTRMGPSSKVIVTGDKSQIDLPPRQKSGLLEVLDVLKETKNIEFVHLDERDVLRHRLVKSIIKAYHKHYES
ncbi:MAG: PhoH family protein [Flammeovirgaceae bacterium]|nr:PhoH family protein [Flammeovirgaceae bacterium]